MDKMLHELDIITINGKDIGIKGVLMDTISWALHGNWCPSKQTPKILFSQGSLWKKQSLSKLELTSGFQSRNSQRWGRSELFHNFQGRKSSTLTGEILEIQTRTTKITSNSCFL